MKKMVISGKCGFCKGAGEIQRGQENSCKLFICPVCFGSGELQHEYIVDETLEIKMMA